MDKAILKNTMYFFATLGNIKSRSMFGGFGIFADDVMFALVVNGQLHLRGAKQNEADFKALGMEPYRYTKRGFPVVSKYYRIPDGWWQDQDELMVQAKRAFEISTQDKQAKKTAVPDRIKDLPNLRLATERLLKKAGIDSVEKLKSAGSLGAYQAVQRTQQNVSLDLLWALEGALDGKHWSVISPQRKTELLQHLDA